MANDSQLLLAARSAYSIMRVRIQSMPVCYPVLSSILYTLMRSRGAKAVLAAAPEPPAVARCIEYILKVSHVVADHDSW